VKNEKEKAMKLGERGKVALQAKQKG